jgi:MFS family permease
VGAVLLGSLGAITRRGRLVGFSLLVYGAAVIAFGTARNVPIAAVAMAVAGAAMLVTVASLNTSVQLLVPEALRGRLVALYIMTFTGAYPIGSLVQGALTDVIGPRATVVGAAAVFLTVGVGVRLVPGLLDSLDEHQHQHRHRHHRPPVSADVEATALE